MSRWRCGQCNFVTNSDDEARMHWSGPAHQASLYTLTDQDRLDDLLELREELRR